MTDIIKELKEELDLSDVYSENKLGKKKKAKGRLTLRLTFLLFFLIIATLIGVSSLSSKTINGQGTGKGFGWLSSLSVVGQLSHLTATSEQKLKGEERNRINILLTGIGGGNHDGGQLADTIMLISLDPTNKQAGVVSVPRDLTVPIEGYGWRKINSINALSEKDGQGAGAKALAQAFTTNFNQPIDYYLRVDFSGFSQFIDDLGGIDVLVENQLDDYAYPILGQEDNPNYYARYKHLHVETGLQHMDGDLALAFARSRHGINGEGSDFARARRQQLIIEAVKDKLKQTNLFLNPSIITKTIGNYQEHVATNLEIWEIAKLWRLFKDTEKSSIASEVLRDGPNGLLRSDRGLDGAYILVPKSDDFTEIKALMENILAQKIETAEISLENEKPSIIVLNGTATAGLATQKALELETKNFTIIDKANADRKDYETSLLYDLSNSSKPESLAFLTKESNCQPLNELPLWLQEKLEAEASYIADFQKPDFILLLGQNAINTIETDNLN